MKDLKDLKSEKGQMGIGLLIVFIAVVLVAAVGAIVIITTSGTMQERAYTTSKDSLHTVATNMNVQALTGLSTNQTTINSTAGYETNTINETIVRVKLQPGAEKVNLRKTILAYTTKNRKISPIVYNVSASDNADSNYDANGTRANSVADYSVKYLQTAEDTPDKMLEPNEIVEFHFWIEDSSGEYPLDTDTDFELAILPNRGVSTSVNAETPGTIEKMYTLLYP